MVDNSNTTSNTPLSSNGLNSTDMDYLPDFLQECRERCGEIEAAVLATAQNTVIPYPELLRLLHTLKGDCGIMDLHTVVEVLHAAESTLVQFQEQNLALPVHDILALKDYLIETCRCLEDGQPIPEPDSILHRVSHMQASTATATLQSTPPAATEHDIEYLQEIETHLDQAQSIIQILHADVHDTRQYQLLYRHLHIVLGEAAYYQLPVITDICERVSRLMRALHHTAAELDDASLQVIELAIELLLQIVDRIAFHVTDDNNDDNARLQSLLDQLAQLQPDDYSADPAPIQPAATTAPAAPSRKHIENKAAEPSIETNVDSSHPTNSGDSTTRVSTNRLDNLIDMIGELVVAHAVTLERDAKSETSSDTEHHTAGRMTDLSKIIRELQDISMSLRMITLKATFQKMVRLVWDIAEKSEKSVRYDYAGEMTEMDRNMIDALGDPLIHLLRNAVDHGIETPEERQAAGKNPEGHIHLNAYTEAGNIVLEVQDDGRGLDRDAILAKALDQDLLSAGGNYTDEEIYHCIFEAGFSTKKELTDISGRGVGMDVVNKGIKDLRGQIHISSQPNQGTTFTLRLPLTLAIIEGMAVRIGQDKYILPTLSILESIRPTDDQVTTVTDIGKVVNIRGRLLQLVSVGDLLSVPGYEDDISNSLVIIVTVMGKEYAFQVDEILGQQQVVIKNLGEQLDRIPGVSGGAILGDGTVSLILDPGGICRLYKARQH
jgi:two-component system, chemotaxis family, sensor kinase CheA